MRAKIHNFDYDKRMIEILSGRRLEFFYLKPQLFTLFAHYFKPGLYLDFQVYGEKTTHFGVACYNILSIEEIYCPKTKSKLFSKNLQRQIILDSISKSDYFLCLDLEMEILNKYDLNKTNRANFSQIIQIGYSLFSKTGNVIIEKGYYLLTKENQLNYKTQKFLNIDLSFYKKNAYTFTHFYDELSTIINIYSPKLVVWGNYDIITINKSFDLYELNPLISATSFIDLLKIHKNFYSLKNDLGLFNAYEAYYNKVSIQEHNALTDAVITKEVLLAFISNNIMKG